MNWRSVAAATVAVAISGCLGFGAARAVASLDAEGSNSRVSESPSSSPASGKPSPAAHPSKPAPAQAEQFGAGAWVVGVHVLPGVYSTSGTKRCKWKRLGPHGERVEQGGGFSQSVVLVDVGTILITQRCGRWTRLP